MDENLSLLDEIVLEILEGVDSALFEDIEDEEQLLLEIKAIKKKVIRSLLLTLKYTGCPEGYRIDPETKQCIKMSTGEIKMLHKLAKRSAKLFKKRGTGVALLKNRRRAKSLLVGKRLHIYHPKKKLK
jgi:hypothetical protein